MILVMISVYAYLHNFVPPISSTIFLSNNRTNAISQECNSFMDNLKSKLRTLPKFFIAHIMDLNYEYYS